MTKLLFLDFDGVLNSYNGLIKRDFGEMYYTVYEEEVSELNWLCEQIPDLKIIISSSWRKRKTIKEMSEILEKNGFKHSDMIDGITDNLRDRLEEIRKYVSKYPVDDVEWVSLDDIHFKDVTDEELSRIIEINSNYGLQRYDVFYAEKVLNSKRNKRGFADMPMVLF